MNRNQIKTIVIKGLSSYSKIPEGKIKEEHSLIKDLGFDSLDAVEMIMHIEEKFGIDIPDSDADDLRTVKKVIDYIYKKSLNKKIGENIMITDKYLKYIQEGEEGGFWHSVKSFFELSQSKHPKFSALSNSYEKAEKRCRLQFAPSRDINIKIGDPHNPAFTYKDYVENPDYVLCEMRASLEFWNDLIKWFKSSTPEEICKLNINKDRCTRWVENTREEGISELDFLKGELKNKKMNKQQFERVASRLQR